MGAVIALVSLLLALAVGCGGGLGPLGLGGDEGMNTMAVVGNMVAFGMSELGMHCMNQDFSKLMILPPFNTLRAQVVDRTGQEPEIVRSNVTVNFSVLGNTRSADKTNFWDFEEALLGFPLAANTGLTGTRLSGPMHATGDGRFEATGIPLTPVMDKGTVNPYPLGSIVVKKAGTIQAITKTVVPVSWEISCNLCHTGAQGTDMDILQAHDRLHHTDLQNATPVACGRCHEQPPLAGVLGSGSPALPTLSRAMHRSHGPRMKLVSLPVNCYACHPGVTTKCLRDVHRQAGMTCLSCHGSMAAVASAARQPWVDEPACGSCHQRSGFEFEEPGKLFRESRGHNGIYCEACHNSPHATVPTVTKADNIQNIGLQGKAGTIDKCSLCHSQTPDEPFNHTLRD